MITNKKALIGLPNSVFEEEDLKMPEKQNSNKAHPNSSTSRIFLFIKAVGAKKYTEARQDVNTTNQITSTLNAKNFLFANMCTTLIL